MMNLINSSWKVDHGFGATDGDSPHKGFESQKSLGIRSLTILPRFEYFLFKSLWIRVRMDL
jgi:hypothetical protein